MDRMAAQINAVESIFRSQNANAQTPGFTYDPILISLTDKPSWYMKDYNPAGKVPCMVIGEEGRKILTESTVLMEHVDKHYRKEKPSLLAACSREEFERAELVVSQVASINHKIVRSPTVDKEDEKRFHDACCKLDQAIKGPFFSGHDLTMSDLVVYPFVHPIECIAARFRTQGGGDDPAGVPIEGCPKLNDFIMNVRQQLPGPVGNLPRIAQCKAYLESVKSGRPNPDI